MRTKHPERNQSITYYQEEPQEAPGSFVPGALPKAHPESPIDIEKIQYYLDKCLQHANVDTSTRVYVARGKFYPHLFMQELEVVLVTPKGDRDCLTGIDVMEYEMYQNKNDYFLNVATEIISHLTC